MHSGRNQCVLLASALFRELFNISIFKRAPSLHSDGLATQRGIHFLIFDMQSAIVTANPNQRWRSLKKGQRVEFIVIETEKGLQAEEVTGPDGAPIKQPSKHYWGQHYY